jgi:hypothetical protein
LFWLVLEIVIYKFGKSFLIVICLSILRLLVWFYDEATKSETGFFIFAFVMTVAKSHFFGFSHLSHYLDHGAN